MDIKIKKVAGFTLIEVLVTLSIITVLSTAASVSFIQYREKSKITKTTAEISKIHQAINLLYNYTGKLPKGCVKDVLIDAEAYLNTQKGGLIEKPVADNSGGNCEWTEDDLSGWNGPYFQSAASNNESLIDPWGNKYYVDFDYYGSSGYSPPSGPEAGPGCPSKLHNGIAVVSMGPDEKQYTCDDIAEYIKDCGSQKLSDCL